MFKFHWGAFIVAFSLTILYVYIHTPPPKVVMKFPTPFNAGHVMYQDAAESCYVFDAIEVKPCPADKDLIRKQPIIEKFADLFR